MKNSVTYSVIQRKSPRNPLDAPKFYAQAQARGEADIRALSDRIQVMCTVTRPDVLAVLSALEVVVSDSLSNGEIVRLGDLGSLQISLSSTGALTKEEFSTALINKVRILFRPGETLSNMKRTLKYERVEPKPKKGEEGAGDPDAEGGKTQDQGKKQGEGEQQDGEEVKP